MDDLATRLEREAPELAAVVVAEMRERHPEMFERYGAHGGDRCLEDTSYHLRFLADAVDQGDPEVFRGYRSWLESVLTPRGVPVEDIDLNFEALELVLDARYGVAAAPAAEMLRAAREMR